MVKECHAYPTHGNAHTILTKCAEHLNKYSEEYGKLSKPFWKKVYMEKKGMPNTLPQKMADVKTLIEELKS